MRITRSHSSSQHGFAHLGIILAIVGVVVVAGLVAWRFMGANGALNIATGGLSEKLASAKCDYDDKDLCKFFVSWKEHQQYKMVTSTALEDGSTMSSTYEISGDNSHMVTTGQYASEVIMIGELTTYTKAADGTWWKQTREKTETPDTAVTETTETVDFEEPTAEQAKDATTYKALGKEACGDLTCFKYQVLSKGTESTTQYIWFDTKDYQLRRTTYDGGGMKSDTSFSYENVSVKAPANFKELGPNQYLVPGQSEPATMPSAADYNY